jgi:hypothetical protein
MDRLKIVVLANCILLQILTACGTGGVRESDPCPQFERFFASTRPSAVRIVADDEGDRSPVYITEFYLLEEDRFVWISLDEAGVPSNVSMLKSGTVFTIEGDFLSGKETWTLTGVVADSESNFADNLCKIATEFPGVSVTLDSKMTFNSESLLQTVGDIERRGQR